MRPKTKESHAGEQGVKAKHTPGPWEVRPGPGFSGTGDEVGLRIADAKGRRLWETVARVNHPTSNQQRSRDESGLEAGRRLIEANARLIAAAPELLEALKGLSKSEDGFCVCVVLRRDRHDDRCSAARAAIAKAEGGE